MTQLSLIDLPVETPKKRVNVPRTSVLAYRNLPTRTKSRRIEYALEKVMRWPCMTSLEMLSMDADSWDTDAVLFLRRGLSDAKAKGLVEHGPARRCGVSKTKSVTWKVCTR